MIIYFLFSPLLFPDQFQYAGEAMSLKATGSSAELTVADTWGIGNTVTLTAKMLGVVPLPNYMTVTSLAFANKFLLFVTFYYCHYFFD